MRLKTRKNLPSTILGGSFFIAAAIAVGYAKPESKKPIDATPISENFTGTAELLCVPTKVINYFPLSKPTEDDITDKTYKPLTLRFQNGKITGYDQRFFSALTDENCSRPPSQCAPKETKRLSDTYTLFDVQYGRNMGYSAIFAKTTPIHSTLVTQYGSPTTYTEHHHFCITTNTNSEASPRIDSAPK